eukprot:m.22968 g.22968  ORF g.22968 m.22968 type:complete len:103 (+) comp11312_c0_seq2:32-340(+)
MQVAVLFVCVASWLSAVGGEDVCAKTDFHHGNFRCKCTCPVDTEPLEDGSKETGCTATSQNYDAGGMNEVVAYVMPTSALNALLANSRRCHSHSTLLKHSQT